MGNPLRLAIPVMTQYEGEIKAFLAAKKRLEEASAGTKLPLEVGVFLYYTDKAITPEVRVKQRANQRLYKLPIFHAQAPIYQHNSLAFAEEEAARFPDRASMLEATIEQAAWMRDLGPQTPFSEALSVETHPGVIVYPDFNPSDPTDTNRPSTYSIQDFLEKRDRLLEIMKARYAALKERGALEGVAFGIENCHAVVLEPDRWAGNKPRFNYTPFGDIASLRHMAGVSPENAEQGRYLVFDIAHQATARDAPDAFRRNDTPKNLAHLLNIYDVQTPEEFLRRFGDIPTKLGDANTIQLSNVTGLGVHLGATPELEKRWGKDGTFKGVLTRDEMRGAIEHARAHGIPLALELDYDIKKIPTNQFVEVDKFLASLYRDE